RLTSLTRLIPLTGLALPTTSCPNPQLYRPPESCRPESEPLCASDGHTYPSECAMTATGVQKGISSCM
uniref:Kazal-like domain-containing protein n=1 Tax=Xiphophorus couchianus TaxID=32473 RepID=A0A3B5KQ91_9TELE